MFSRRIRVEYEQDGKRRRCPLKWLDSFAMRNFTNETIFDDTLPVEDGVMEIGERVRIDGDRQVRARLQGRQQANPARGGSFRPCDGIAGRLGNARDDRGSGPETGHAGARRAWQSRRCRGS